MGDPSDECACGPADALNERCFCVSLDRVALTASLEAQLHKAGVGDVAEAARADYFSDVPVFVRRHDIELMRQVVAAIDRVSRLPGYGDAVSAWAPETARFAAGPIGAFMGFDFHLTSTGPRLIEVNTNAGGAFMNAELARAQRVCCREADAALDTIAQLDRFDAAVISMFESEWRRQRGGGRPATLAIVDDDPRTQPMYAEFRLAQNLLTAHGIETLIVDPGELARVGAELRVGERRIDMVYNRLVDFAFSEPRHRVLRDAYLDGGVVVTPNPHVHARFADKRNLVVLSDLERLHALGADAADAELLAAAVPRAVLVTQEAEESLWQSRREWFFKPVSGHGSKGVYRGKTVTRGTFERIVEDGYIAQRYVRPSERSIRVGGQAVALKVDVRLYTYDAQVLLSAARIYHGQATNMRTSGGGFAPVFQA